MRDFSVFKAILMLTVAVSALPLAAQDAEEAPTPDRREADSGPGSRVNAGFDLSVGYDDNVYATRNRELDDFYLLARPFVRADLGAGDTRLTLRGEGEIGRYEELTSEDYDDWMVSADGRARLSGNLSLLGGAEWRWNHESRSSPEAVSGLEPTQYQRGFGYLGLLGTSGRFSGRIAGTATRYDFDDVATTGGTINNDDRDRWQSELGARAGMSLRSGAELFMQGTYDRRDYDDRLDDSGFARNSDGLSLVAGVRGRLGEEFTGELFAGWLQQDYRDARLKDLDTFDIGAVLDWNGKSGLGGSLRADRSVEETTLPGASGYVVTSGRISLRADVHPRLRAGMGLSGSHYDYIGDPRTEFVIGGDVWARYWLNRHVYLGADYTHAERSSNAAGYDFDQNRFMLSLGAQLRPAYSGETMPLTFGGEVPGGPYLGLLFGHGSLVSGLDGPRGQGGNTADFGDHGAAAVAVAGYGVLVESLYLGLEAEGSLGGPDWLHTADRVFSMKKENAFGLAARVGIAAPHGALAYGRFAISSAEIRTDYTHGNNVYSDGKRHLGFGPGVGIEAPAGRRGFVRAEYVVTSYDDIDIPTGGGDLDNCSPTESQFRFGGGFRFGKRAEAADEVAATDFAGAYVGLQVGHGSLVSSNRGTRSGGTQVDIERASHSGLLGLYAGYGAVIDRAYLGLEAEGDISAINWNIERDPNGRIYSTDHDYSFGGSGRAGFLLGDSALVYGRAGLVRTRFEIPYATSGTSVRSTETRTGVRFGGGIEIGLSGRARLRADYTVTQYERYDLQYGQGTADRFDHSESLFRLGLSWRL